MRILGNRILITKLEEEKKEGFQTVDTQDSFLYKGKIEMVGDIHFASSDGRGAERIKEALVIGETVIFTKYSPDTQTIPYNGGEAKIISIDDVLAVL